MERIVIYDLYPIEIETFIDDLEKTEIGNVLGGSFGGLSPIYINTIHGDINKVSTTYEGAGNSHDNKINTVDYSRITNIWVYR